MSNIRKEYQGGLDQSNQSAKAGSNQVVAPVERVQRESEKIAMEVSEILNEFVTYTETTTDAKLNYTLNELTKFIMEYTHKDYQSNVNLGIDIGRREVTTMLTALLDKSERYARPKTYTVVVAQDGTTEQREGMEFIEAIPITEVRKAIKALGGGND